MIGCCIVDDGLLGLLGWFMVVVIIVVLRVGCLYCIALGVNSVVVRALHWLPFGCDCFCYGLHWWFCGFDCCGVHCCYCVLLWILLLRLLWVCLVLAVIYDLLCVWFAVACAVN